MPAPQHLRVEFRGVFGTALAPQEQWSFSLAHEDPAALVTEGDFVAAAGQASLAYAARIKVNMPSNVVLTEVRVARIKGQDADDVAGRVARRADGSLEQGVLAVTMPGEQGPINAPPQLALCVTLLTGRAGASGKGRFYLPMPAVVPSLDDRRLTEADANAWRNRAINLVQDLNGSIGFGSVVVASTKGYLSPVTHVRVGRAVDTIRSRRGKLPEGDNRLAI